MIQYRQTNHVDVNTFNIPFCLCTYWQGRSPQSGRSGIGRTTFPTLIFKNYQLHLIVGLRLFCHVIYLVSVSLVRLLFDMATASFPDISSVSHQPTNITFPKRSFGKKVVARFKRHGLERGNGFTTMSLTIKHSVSIA